MLKSSQALLLVTHDDALWQHWCGLDRQRWLPARGRTVAELERWLERNRGLVVFDRDLPRCPGWRDPVWAQVFGKGAVIVASPAPNDEEGTQVLGAGAQGYCHAYASAAALDQVLDVVASGGTWAGRSLITRLLRLVAERGTENSSWHRGLLTDRELAVAHRAAHGQSNAQIAVALDITERTVKAHLSSVFDKLEVDDRLQLALKVHGVAHQA